MFPRCQHYVHGQSRTASPGTTDDTTGTKHLPFLGRIRAHGLCGAAGKHFTVVTALQQLRTGAGAVVSRRKRAGRAVVVVARQGLCNGRWCIVAGRGPGCIAGKGEGNGGGKLLTSKGPECTFYKTLIKSHF